MADQINPLVKHQKIFMIDAHGHENNPEERSRMLDDPQFDLHIHKKTNPISINGRKECTVDIRIPINNHGREYSVEIDGKGVDGIPGKLRKEVKRVLDNPEIHDSLVKQLKDILRTYPSNIKEEKDKVAEVLNRLTETFGATKIQLKDEWFTHINQDLNGVSMLSLMSQDDERYNFLACDKFMMAEQAEPTKKTIIRLYGAAQRGKTSTIKKVYHSLLDQHPDHAIIISNGEGESDVKAILFINGAKVGIESQGDPNSRQPRSIDEFVSMGCDVILVAGRTRGMTKDSIYRYRAGYNIEEIYKPYIEADEEREFNIGDVAMELVVMVEGATMRAFEEL